MDFPSIGVYLQACVPASFAFLSLSLSFYLFVLFSIARYHEGVFFQRSGAVCFALPPSRERALEYVHFNN